MDRKRQGDIPKSLAPIFSKKRPRQALLAHPNNENSKGTRGEVRPSYASENSNLQRSTPTQWHHQQNSTQHSTLKPFQPNTRISQVTTAKPQQGNWSQKPQSARPEQRPWSQKPEQPHSARPEQKHWAQKPEQPHSARPKCNQPVQYPAAGTRNILHQNLSRETNQRGVSRNQNPSTMRATSFPGHNQKRLGGQPAIDAPVCAQQPWGTPCLPKLPDSTGGGDCLVESASERRDLSRVENNRKKFDQTREKSSFQVEQRNAKGSQKLITATIEGMKHWSQYKEQMLLTFELFGMLNSAVSFNESCAAKQFLLRDEKDSVMCSFYEIDRELQRLTRGQWYRCVGRLDQLMEKFVCVSIRKASDTERKLIKAAVNASDRIMRDCIFREANEV